MLIECPFCHASANLPSSKEGAKVRCPACDKVYTAREKGRKASGGPSSAQIAIGSAVVLGALLVLVIVNSQDEPALQVGATEEAAPEDVVSDVDPTGWDGELVQAVRALYEAAFLVDETKLMSRISGRELSRRMIEEAAAAEPPLEAPLDWDVLDEAQRDARLRAAALGLIEGDAGDTVAALWNPYDGRVRLEEDGQAVVHVQVAGRSAEMAAESRTIEWKLVREGNVWKAWSWARYISPEELAASRSSRSKEISRVELDDGTKLFQAEARALEHLEDTPEELRTRIDALVARLIDFDLHPRENNAAGTELVEIGRPAIPVLLTAMFETEIVDDDTLAKVGKVHHTLRDLTGYDPGFPITAFEEDSDAKREIAVKAWFAWWLRKGERRFQEKEEGEDLLEALIKADEGPSSPKGRGGGR